MWGRLRVKTEAKKKTNLAAPWSWTSSFQNYIKKMNFFCLSHASLWYFVMAILEDWHSKLLAQCHTSPVNVLPHIHDLYHSNWLLPLNWEACVLPIHVE
jgi:hypothetical protein